VAAAKPLAGWVRIGFDAVTPAVRQGPDEDSGFRLVEVPALRLFGLMMSAAER